MHIVIAGGTGFLGRPLAAHLAAKGHDVTILTRGISGQTPAPGIRTVTWTPEAGGSSPPASPPGWAAALDGTDAVVNLTGAGIADKRWSAHRKAVLRDSRIQPTRALVSAIRGLAKRPAAFIQGSAVGYYGTDSGDRVLDESFPPGSDFFGRMCVEWEAEARGAESLGCRLVFIRSGIALAKGGGALGKMLPPFLFFVGGPIASGRQYISWVHRADWIALVTWAIESAPVTGVYNGTAPHPVTNAELSKAIGRAFHRPSWLRVPGFALKVLVGEVASVALIPGQRVVPKRALEAGFGFKYPTIGEALAAVRDER